MPTITINTKEYHYDESQIINFTEGLIGMPELRRAVLIPMDDYAPFCWLASVDGDKPQFIVVDPHQVFSGYERPALNGSGAAHINTLAIVKISSDWEKTTVNLRAPILINAETRRGAQLVLSDSKYQFAEALPQS